MAFTNGTSGAMIWLMAEVAGLLRQLLGVPDEVIRTDVPHHPEIWGDLCGWYPVSAQLTDTQARGFAGLGAEVFVRRGQLTLRALSPVPAVYRGFPLHPDDDKDPASSGSTCPSLASAPRGSCSVASLERGRRESTPTWFRSRFGSSPPARTRGGGSQAGLVRSLSSPQRPPCGGAARQRAATASDGTDAAPGSRPTGKATTMQTSGLAQLKQDALDKIIFHMTPKQWLRTSGAWVLERGEGALLYDADGREYLDAMSGGLFAVLAGYGQRRSRGRCTTRL